MVVTFHGLNAVQVDGKLDKDFVHCMRKWELSFFPLYINMLAGVYVYNIEIGSRVEESNAFGYLIACLVLVIKIRTH